MAALTANEILKPFYSGEMTGKERYHMIIKKMENSEPFKMDKGGLEMLKFKDESSLRILKSDNPESIHNHFKGSAKPFIFQSDVKGANPFGIRQLEKIGVEEVNKNKIYFRFICQETNTEGV